jgi:putative PIN family toxin of toxin-antitoxin system
VRLVLDTNVLIAAYATQGACMRVYRHCVRHHVPVASDHLFRELEEKLTRKLKLDSATVGEVLALYRSEVVIVDPGPLDQPASRDPDDDWVIATAIAGGCACIVTGDADLWSIDGHLGIRILKPGDFWSYDSTHRPGC